MGPTILAYGRIMGHLEYSSISKWRSVKGRRTPIDPTNLSLQLELWFNSCFILDNNAADSDKWYCHNDACIISETRKFRRYFEFWWYIGYTIYSNIDIIEQIIGQIELLNHSTDFLTISLNEYCNCWTCFHL